MSPITYHRTRAPRVVAVISLLAATAVMVTIVVSAWPAGSAVDGRQPQVSAPEASGTASRPAGRPKGDENRTERRPPRRRPASDLDAVDWRRSVAVGAPSRGSLRKGVKLPATGRTFVTWDPVLRKPPNRPERRYATARLLRALLEVTTAYARAHASAPRVVVGDLSRPRGGDFSVVHGDLGDGKGHVSHQSGLDVDIYYPRSDGVERGATAAGPEDAVPFDRRLAQDLVDRFVAAGATAVFVGTSTGLTGPPGVVKAVARHNDHMHVRFPAPSSS